LIYYVKIHVFGIQGYTCIIIIDRFRGSAVFSMRRGGGRGKESPGPLSGYVTKISPLQ
jgi:hypothetical protein